MAPTRVPSTSTSAFDTRCATARMVLEATPGGLRKEAKERYETSR